MSSRAGFFQLVLCNIKGYLREPEAIFWSYGFPLLMVIGLGIAFQSSGDQPIFVDVVEGTLEESLLEALAEGFQLYSGERSEVFERLRRNQTPLVVSSAEDGQLIYHFDPSNPEARLAREAVNDLLQRAAGRKDALPVADTEETAPGSRYVDFLVPGLIGMNLMGGGMWGIGYMLVDTRIRKLLKRLLGTPMRRHEFLLSAVTTRIMFFIPEAFVLLITSYLLFGIPINGSPLLIVFVAFTGAMAFAGLGLLAASRAQRIETISGILNLVMLPMWICSGVFFSSERFPEIMQPFVQALPLTQLINALRAVILEGQTLPDVWVPISVLVAWMGVSFFLALRWFRWT